LFKKRKKDNKTGFFGIFCRKLLLFSFLFFIFALAMTLSGLFRKAN